MFSRLSRGERFVVVGGGFLLVSLALFPWHRVEGLAMVGRDPTITALQEPNALQGTLAFLLTVAMVAQVVLTRYTNQKVNPSFVRLQAPVGMAVVAVLAWKLASETSFLSIGAYLGIGLAGALAYGGLLMNQGSSGGSAPVRKRRLAVPRIGRKKSGPPVQPVIVIPPGEEGSEYAYIVDLNDHVARLDGSFSVGRAVTVEARGEGIGFDTTDEAVRWAEERGWTVMNKHQL